jgi:hypothetical protein
MKIMIQRALQAVNVDIYWELQLTCRCSRRFAIGIIAAFVPIGWCLCFAFCTVLRRRKNWEGGQMLWCDQSACIWAMVVEDRRQIEERGWGRGLVFAERGEGVEGWRGVDGSRQVHFARV